LFSQPAGNINRVPGLNIEPIMNCTNPAFSEASTQSAPAGGPASSRWVQFNRALAASGTPAYRPGLQGRWKPSDRVVIAAAA
jgi:hypothetical protein